jgi:hypothetical protein
MPESVRPTRAVNRLLTRGVPVVGLTAGAIGGVNLVLWFVGVAARLSASGFLTMKTNMALSLMLASVALVLVEPRRTRPTQRAVGRRSRLSFCWSAA